VLNQSDSIGVGEVVNLNSFSVSQQESSVKKQQLSHAPTANMCCAGFHGEGFPWGSLTGKHRDALGDNINVYQMVLYLLLFQLQDCKMLSQSSKVDQKSLYCLTSCSLLLFFVSFISRTEYI